MLGDEACSLLIASLLGELAEGQCHYEVTRNAFESQQAAPLQVLTHVSLAAIAPQPALDGPGGWPSLPCSSGALWAPTAPC